MKGAGWLEGWSSAERGKVWRMIMVELAWLDIYKILNLLTPSAEIL